MVSDAVTSAEVLGDTIYSENTLQRSKDMLLDDNGVELNTI